MTVFNFSLNLFLLAVSKKDHKYGATRLHFENLVKRYGNPIIILNLIKAGLSHLIEQFCFSMRNFTSLTWPFVSTFVL